MGEVKKPQPPKWINRVLDWYCREEYANEIRGDLMELYERWLEQGKFKANLKYAMNALLFMRMYNSRFATSQHSNQIDMFKNYFKTAYRNMLKNKSSAFVNIFGLALGLACAILILLWVDNESSFDKFHKDYRRTYRVLQHIKFETDVNWAIVQHPLAGSLMDEIPEIETATAITMAPWRIKRGDEEFTNQGLYVEPEFFDIFSFEVMSNDPKQLLNDPYSVIITESMARDRFGKSDPIGEVVKVYDLFDAKVTGVMKDPPFESHLQFDFLTSMALAKNIGYSVDNWSNSGFYTYVKISESSSEVEVNKKIYNFLDEKPTLEEWAKLYLQPINAIHLGSGIDYDSGAGGNRQYVSIFLGSALFILVIACVNFMNLATARASKRTKEVGVRKSIGAFKIQLIHQFLVESVMMSMLAFLLAIAMAYLFMPFFNQFTGKQLAIRLMDLRLIIGFLLIGVSTGLLAGSYPAFFLSSFRPVKVLKGTATHDMKGVSLRKGLVIFQCTISLLLIIGAFTVYSQVDYMKNKEIGFDKENLVYFLSNQDINGSLSNFKAELLRDPSVRSVGGSASFPSAGFQFSNSLWRWPEKTTGEDVLFRAEYVDYDYIKTFGLEILEGRGFSKDFKRDSSALIMNESAIKAMGLTNPIGTKIARNENEGFERKIIGIVRDYNFRTLHSAVEPLILIPAPERVNYIWARVDSENLKSTLEFIESKFKERSSAAFGYGFLDESLARQYESEERIGTILQFFTSFAIIVLCLGILGLVGFSVEQKGKEIAMRKVLGARDKSILGLFIKDYSRPLMLSILLSSPLAFYGITRWLQSFPYKMNISPTILILPSVGLLILSYSIILLKSYGATRVNIVKNLRSS